MMLSGDVAECLNPSIGPPAREIIIVDDNEEWRDLLAAILELEGYVVTGYSDGNAFLKEATDRTPICVFLDVFMPGPSGLEVLERLAQIGYEAPIFLISARADAPVVLEGARNGALGVIEKPFDPYSAVLRVRQAADLWAQRATSQAVPAAARSRFAGVAGLTRQQCTMLAQIADGTSTERAAKDLGISTRAAARYRAEIKKKFGVKRFPELVRIALNEIARAKQHAVDLPLAREVTARDDAMDFPPPRSRTASVPPLRRRPLAGIPRAP
jgi:two-component system response regulator FixJ